MKRHLTTKGWGKLYNISQLFGQAVVMKQDPVEALSLWPCNQNVYSNKILFFFGLNLFSCLLLRSNFCFLPRRNSLVFSLFSLCTCVTLFLRLVILQDWEKKKKKKKVKLEYCGQYSSFQSSSTMLFFFFLGSLPKNLISGNSSSKHRTRVQRPRVLFCFFFFFS